MKESVSICWNRGGEVKLHQWVLRTKSTLRAWLTHSLALLEIWASRLPYSSDRVFTSPMLLLNCHTNHLWGEEASGVKTIVTLKKCEWFIRYAAQIQFTSAHVCDSRTKAYSEWPNWMVTKRFAPCSCLQPPPPPLCMSSRVRPGNETFLEIQFTRWNT